MAAQNRQEMSLGGKLLLSVLGIVILLIVALSCLAFVPAGSEGVLLVWGAVTNYNSSLLSPGLHIIIPIEEGVISMNTRTQLYQVQAAAASKDLQNTYTTIGIDYQANPTEAALIYNKYGSNYQNNIIAPLVQETVKAVTAQYNATDLITDRPTVQQEIQANLTYELLNYGLTVQQVSITNFSFSSQFSAAIENKVVQSQNLLANETRLQIVTVLANQTVASARGNATSRILIAEANATAIELRANATAYSIEKINQQLNQSPKYVSYLIASEWKGNVPSTVVGSGSSSVVPFINLNASGGNN